MASRRPGRDSRRDLSLKVEAQRESESDETSEEDSDEEDDKTRPRHLPEARPLSVRRHAPFTTTRPEGYSNTPPAARSNTRRPSVTGPASLPLPSHAARANRATDPLDGLSPVLNKFVHYGESMVDSCITYCEDHPSIWDEDYRRLLDTARAYLRQGNRDGARRAAQRYLLLKISSQGIEGASQKRRKLVQVRKAISDDALAQLVNEELDKVQAEIKQQSNEHPPAPGVNMRHTSSTPSKPPTERTKQNIASREDPVLVDSQPAALPLSTGAEALNFQNTRPTDSLNRRATVSTIEIQDLDSVADALAGGPGPATAIVGDWGPVRDFLGATFEVYEGDQNISRVFGIGSLIAVYWHENFGSGLPSKLKNLPRAPQPRNPQGGVVTADPKGVDIYSTVRRFIIVTKRQGFSVAIPITTYGNRGLTKKNVNEREQMAHAIVYSQSKRPVRLNEEPKFQKPAICVKMNNPVDSLHPSSRLYYAKPQSIGHNIKVKHLGQVIPEHSHALLLAFQQELQPMNL